ncbi:Na/Pi symporter [Bacillus sp. DTU_2020_1000418_1_SI_GHA_SEK_038]|uniref:Na/Pi symporter n=1 Tax=Bacillus sp. DTU_2020_1000418_1_SI_GHA_SEK_038 TaxID=3077585 RepID=UPI0028E2C627|nr:Na/Pi symporter [Bacillus sp. DTU_2020_1000418_1_SI_GHA_SEK_038]WNS74348.1 Na/Pi symporter [Bacillus sp. DTU_2020_1000418_1_SI_GHA_SEK_038]
MTQAFLFILFIGVFIYGMTLLRSGLYNLSGDSLKNVLTKLTASPWKGLLAGIGITCILQSSSAVMIITIGLISARLLSFPQSIGIILGTNIGTTVTTELITFDIESFLIPFAFLGAVLFLFGKRNVRNIGLILLGISAVFSAMGGFEYLAGPLRSIDFVNQLLLQLKESYLLSILAGTIITAIIQSSTATTGIIMGFLSGGAFGLDTGIAIMLGSNIGTCVDAFLASIGGGREARLCAYAHIWLNVIGVIVFYPFIGWLTSFGVQLASAPDVQLAHIGVLFNVISSLMVLPFATQFGKLIIKIHDR